MENLEQDEKEVGVVAHWVESSTRKARATLANSRACSVEILSRVSCGEWMLGLMLEKSVSKGNADG